MVNVTPNDEQCLRYFKTLKYSSSKTMKLVAYCKEFNSALSFYNTLTYYNDIYPDRVIR